VILAEAIVRKKARRGSFRVPAPCRAVRPDVLPCAALCHSVGRADWISGGQVFMAVARKRAPGLPSVIGQHGGMFARIYGQAQLTPERAGRDLQSRGVNPGGWKPRALAHAKGTQRPYIRSARGPPRDGGITPSCGCAIGQALGDRPMKLENRDTRMFGASVNSYVPLMKFAVEESPGLKETWRWLYALLGTRLDLASGQTNSASERSVCIAFWTLLLIPLRLGDGQLVWLWGEGVDFDGDRTGRIETTNFWRNYEPPGAHRWQHAFSVLAFFFCADGSKESSRAHLRIKSTCGPEILVLGHVSGHRSLRREYPRTSGSNISAAPVAPIARPRVPTRTLRPLGPAGRRTGVGPLRAEGHGHDRFGSISPAARFAGPHTGGGQER